MAEKKIRFDINAETRTQWVPCPGCAGQVCFGDDHGLHTEPACRYFIATDVLDIIRAVRKAKGFPDPNSEENRHLSPEEFIEKYRRKN